MFWTMVLLLLFVWLLGVLLHVGGGWIHMLLVVAVAVFVLQLATGRRTV